MNLGHEANSRRLLIDEINKLRSAISHVVESRLEQFAALGASSDEDVFKELCFCILTANFTAERAMMIQEQVNDGFLTHDEKELASRLKSLGYRFPNTRARYIVEARGKMHEIISALRTTSDTKKLREWLVKHVKGLGMKEASHFLRNIGFNEVAIIDFHIIDLLVKFGIIKRPKTLTPKKYRDIEIVLEVVARDLGLSLGELDLYLWYMETGKILK